MSSTTTITMPQLGETVTEGTITRWLKNVGDSIEKYEAFAEVATDKVNAEIPSPVAGTLLAILVTEGQTVPTGAAIAQIGLASSQAAPPPSPSARPTEAAATTLSAPPPSELREQPHRRFSPAVRRALREHRLDPTILHGTGHEGRITLGDVERAATATERIPLSRARRTIAEHMLRATLTIPQAWTMIEVDVSQLVAKRQAKRDQLRTEIGITPTYFHYFSHAVVTMLARHPMMNARFCEDAIEVYRHVHLAFAVALEGTLVTPVIHDAQSMNFAELSHAMSSVTERARSGHLRINELQGGTITVNNTGANGSILSKPIINAGQAAIVSMESIVKRPIVIEGDAIAIRSMLNICCTIDHRVIDGDVVGGFLRDLKNHLAHPV